MKALIFAAGLGTRLKPITDTLPKALVPVSGQPLLWHVIEKLKRAGITDFVINVHHFADKIRDYVAANNSFGVNIAFSDETDLLRETGGGIRHAAPLLGGTSPLDSAPMLGVSPLLNGTPPMDSAPLLGVSPLLNGTSPLDSAPQQLGADSGQSQLTAADSGSLQPGAVQSGCQSLAAEPFLVHNVDILSNLDIEQFIAKHMETSDSAPEYHTLACQTPAHHTLATLLVSDRQTQRYLLFNQEDLMVGWMNIQTGQVKSPYPHLRREPAAVGAASSAASSAVHSNASTSAFDWQVFLQEHSLKKYAFDGAHIISPEIFGLMEGMPEKFSIIDFYLGICHKYNIRYHIQPNLEMIDVGKLDSLQKAEEFLLA